jgi:hypothetical protein
MADSDVAQELAAGVGQVLPPVYIGFLDSLPSRPTPGKDYGPILEFRGRHWRPYTRAELSSHIQYNRGTSRPRAYETAAIAEFLLSGNVAPHAEMTWALTKRGFAVERVARGFCIGDDGNGEPLFVDPESGGVFAFYHDGMDVEPWSTSLDELIKASRDLMERLETDTPK